MVESESFLKFHFFIYFKKHDTGSSFVVLTITQGEKYILYPLLVCVSVHTHTHTHTHTLRYVNCISLYFHYKLPWWLSGKEPTCDARVPGDLGMLPGLGRSPGEGHGNPLQYACLENPMNSGA